MTERGEPDLDRVRDALRRHDERPEGPREDEPGDEPPAQPDDDDDDAGD